jgi:cholest-4-en-3-one 26-monooxygenase
MPNAIEEILRHSPPIMQFGRTAAQDFGLQGQHIKAGDKVHLSYVSANRDEDVVAEPDRFDILRPEAHQHLSFGAGPHFCIGHGQARLQLATLLTELFTARPHVAVRALTRQYRSSWLNALTEMQVDYHTAAAVAQ